MAAYFWSQDDRVTASFIGVVGFAGLIDDVYVYNRTLTAQEIAILATI